MNTATIANHYNTHASKETLAAAAVVCEAARETIINSAATEYVDAFNLTCKAIHRALKGETPITQIKLAGLDGFIISTYAAVSDNLTAKQAQIILKGRPMPIFKKKTKVSKNYDTLVEEHKQNKKRLEKLAISLNECREANKARKIDIMNRAKVINSSDKPDNDPELLRVMREINARKASYKNTENTIKDLSESFAITRARIDDIEDQLHAYALAKELAQVEMQNKEILDSFNGQESINADIKEETISEILRNMPLAPVADSESELSDLGLEMDIKNIRKNGIEV